MYRDISMRVLSVFSSSFSLYTEVVVCVFTWKKTVDFWYISLDGTQIETGRWKSNELYSSGVQSVYNFYCDTETILMR